MSMMYENLLYTTLETSEQGTSLYIEYEDDDMSPLVGLELHIRSLREIIAPFQQRVWISDHVRAGTLLHLTLYPTYHNPSLPMLYGDASPVRAKEVFQHWSGHQSREVLKSLVFGIIATAELYSTNPAAATTATYNAIRLLHTQADVPKHVLISLLRKWCVLHPQLGCTSAVLYLIQQLKYDVFWGW